MKKLNIIKRALFLAGVISMMVGTHVFAGEGNSLVVDSTHTGAPGKPYSFVDSFSYGYGYDNYVNNGFNLPAGSSGSTKYVEFKAPSDNGGYLIISDTAYSIYESGSTYNYKANTPIYFEPGQRYVIGLPADTTSKYINFELHQHYKNEVSYTKVDSGYCNEITYCGCGYTKSTTSYKVIKKSHVMDSETTKPATCTSPAYNVKSCVNCGYESNTAVGSALGHSYTGAVSPNNSSNHKISCSRCTSYTTESHSFISNGVTKTCTVCNYQASASEYGGTVTNVVPGSVYVTKLSSKSASVTVVVPNKATSTDVYMNDKKIKTVTGRTNFVINQKGIANAKFKVCSNFVVNGVATTSGFSALAKPEANVYVVSGAGSSNPKNVGSYGTCTHRTERLSFSGSKLKCSAYIYNNRMFKLKRIKVNYNLTVNGKTYRKSFVKKVNIPAYGKKRISYVLGKGVSDLRNGTMYKSVYTDGDWGFGWNK